MLECGCGRTEKIRDYRCLRFNPRRKEVGECPTRNSPAYASAIADAVADAKRIVERIEQENRHR
jgi:hypothetical protein